MCAGRCAPACPIRAMRPMRSRRAPAATPNGLPTAFVPIVRVWLARDSAVACRNPHGDGNDAAIE